MTDLGKAWRPALGHQLAVDLQLLGVVDGPNGDLMVGQESGYCLPE